MQKTCRQSVIVDSSPVLPIDQTFSFASLRDFFFFSFKIYLVNGVDPFLLKEEAAERQIALEEY